MKLKPLYIYLIGFVLFVGVIIFFSMNKSKAPNDAVHQQGMPSDEVHKGMGMPGMTAMSDAFKKKDAEFKEAIDKNPKDTVKMKEYATFLMAAHKPVESMKYLQKILDFDGKRIDVLLNMTYLYDIQGNAAEAENLTNRILSIDKNNQPANFNLAILMEKKGDKKKAEQIWTDLIKKNPKSEIATMAQEELDRMTGKTPKK